MKWTLPVFCILFTVLIACNKDKFNTRPSLKLKSVNAHTISTNSTLVFDFDFTDKEGDVSNMLYMKKIRTNRRMVPIKLDTFNLAVPDFPTKLEGTIEVSLDYNNYLVTAINPPRIGTTSNFESDSLTFKFALKDKKNNISDTVTVTNIVIQR